MRNAEFFCLQITKLDVWYVKFSCAYLVSDCYDPSHLYYVTE